MKRRTFIAEASAALVPFAGCTGIPVSDPDPPPPDGPIGRGTTKSRTQRTLPETNVPAESVTGTTNIRQGSVDTCNGATFLSFYATGEDFIWSPSQVAVGYFVGAGAQIRIVVYEDDTMLGMTQYHAPNDTGVNVDGQPIPLNTRLSGEHTIRAIMYEDGTSDPKEATPCRNEGEIIQTEPATLNFSGLSENTSPTPQTSSAE